MHKPRPSLRAAALVALACLAGGALADVPTHADIYQQRGADGSIVLTDRPSNSAVTERTWQVPREDAGAAQRAADVRREADAVSERVQRMIEAQERRAADRDLMRMRMARVDRSAEADDSGSDGYGYGYGYVGAPFPAYSHRHRGPNDGRPPIGPHRPVQGSVGSHGRAPPR